MVAQSWIELICAYPGGSSVPGEDSLHLAIPQCSVAVSDSVNLGEVERLGLDMGSFSGGPGSEDETPPPRQLMLAHRLDWEEGRWVARCDQPLLGGYEAMLEELERWYPDGRDPSGIVTAASGMLSVLGEAPGLAARYQATLEPVTSGGIIWRGRGVKFVLLPVAVLLQWAVARQDPDVIAEVQGAVAGVPVLASWLEACAQARESLATAQRLLTEIRGKPGIRQAELPDATGLGRQVIGEVLWTMEWAQVVRRERDGRTYRLYVIEG